MKRFDLKFEKELISWNYNNKAYNLKIHGLTDVITDEGEYICIENQTQNAEEQVQQYTFDGKLSFTYIVEQGMISWKNADKTMKIYVEEFDDAQIYQNYNVIAVITGGLQKKRKLTIYSMEGQLICEQGQKENYYSSYLVFGVNGSPAIMCEGKYIFDSKYSINPINGELKKISRKHNIYKKYRMRSFIKGYKKIRENK